LELKNGRGVERVFRKEKGGGAERVFRRERKRKKFEIHKPSS